MSKCLILIDYCFWTQHRPIPSLVSFSFAFKTHTKTCLDINFFNETKTCPQLKVLLRPRPLPGLDKTHLDFQYCQNAQMLRILDRGDKEFLYIVTSRARKVVGKWTSSEVFKVIFLSKNSTKMHILHNISNKLGLSCAKLRRSWG